jgi:predicted porin
MKKSLIALAALASTGAFAQSSAMSITGGIDALYRNVSHDDATKKVKGINNNGTYTSQIDFSGKYDIAGGTSAGFFLEMDFNPQISSTGNQAVAGNAPGFTAFSGTPFTGEQLVRLDGAFGTVRLGVPNSPALTAGVTAQPFGTALGSGYSGGFGRLGTNAVSGVNSYLGGPNSSGRIIRHEKTLQYITPNLQGVTATIEFSAKNANSGTATSNTNGMLGLAAAYNQGPVNAIIYSGKVTGALSSTVTPTPAAGSATIPATGLTVQNNVIADGSSVKWLLLGGNYKIDTLTVYGGYTTTKSTSTAGAAVEDSKSYNVAAKYTIGQIDVLGNLLQRKSGLSGTQAIAPKATLLGLGANYNLSDKVMVYGRIENIKNITIAGTAPNQVGQKQSTTGAGVRVLF